MAVLDQLVAVGGFRDAAKQLVRLASEAGLRPRITSVRRSRARQAALYRNWIAGRSPYPAAPPGRSKHERGLAFDVVVTPLSALRALGEAWESVGGVWGGRFSKSDPVHFEAPW